MAAFVGNLTAGYTGETYYSTTTREDLSDLISIMTPTDTPLHSLLDSRTVHDTTWDWAMDDLGTPTTVTQDEEGEAVTATATGEVSRVIGSLSIYKRSVLIADTRRHVLEAGMSDFYNYALWKESVLCMKQMEFNMHWSRSTALSTTNSTDRSMVGVVSWIGDVGGSTPATINGIQIDTIGSAAFKPNYYGLTAAAATNISRGNLHDDILSPAWNKGMNIEGSIFFMSAQTKRLISDMANVYANSTFRRMAADNKRMEETIDVFESDFGAIYMNLDRYMMQTTTAPAIGGTLNEFPYDACIFGIEPDKFHRATMRGLGHVPLAKTGDNTQGFVVYEAGIQCDNPRAGTIGVNITT